MSSFSHIAGLLCATALSTAPASAQAPVDDDIRARDLFDNGTILYEEGRYAAAIAAWESGYALSSRPLFLFNLAGAWERLGSLDEAITYLDQYRALAPASERDTLTRRIGALERRRHEAVVATAPFPTVPVLATSVAAIGLGVSVGYGISAQSARRQADSLCVGGLCSVDAKPFVQRDHRHALVSDIALGVGLAAAAVSVTTVFLPRGSAQVGVSDRGVQLSGRF